jgi:hypothetical protein
MVYDSDVYESLDASTKSQAIAHFDAPSMRKPDHRKHGRLMKNPTEE